MKVIQVATEAESPKGAPFIVDRCDFLAGGCIPLEYSSRDIERDKLENWPMSISSRMTRRPTLGRR